MFESFEKACAAARADSLRNPECSIHVNAVCMLVGDTSTHQHPFLRVPTIVGFQVSDWFADGATLCTYYKGTIRY